MRIAVNSTFVPNLNLPFATVTDQFMAAATRHPQAIALEQGTDVVTYADLLRIALALASACTTAGVLRGALVAVDAERTIDTVAAILGILFAGGAYVPVQTCDATTIGLLQQHQIRFLISDQKPGNVPAGVCVLPTKQRPASASVRIFDMPGEECGLEDPAYVLFTSGSTGARKGVVVPHRGIIRLVNQQTFISMNSKERMLLHSPLTFDASTLELWAALLHGGTVVLAPARSLSVDDFRTLVSQHRVTTLWLTAGIFHLVAQHAMETFSTLQQLIVGGDVIHASLFAEVKRRFPQLRLVNGYGPTENTTFTTCYVAPVGFAESKVPIGEPVTGTSVYILDEAGQPVLDGDPGELAAGGNGLALGYLNEPELTASRFPLALINSGTNERLYLTGDIVRRRADHQLEFLGRKDSEVKLAGQRIQLDDVEHAILSSSLVRSCTALAMDEGIDKVLVAFVVWQDREAEDELRTALKLSLPSIAMPRVLYTVATVPLTENGKVDRARLRTLFLAKGLPREDLHPTVLNSGHRDWSGIVERLWCRILHREAVDPLANFFDLGGDSLGLIVMQAELQQLTCFAPSIMELFALPNVKSIADSITAAESASGAVRHSSTLDTDFILTGTSA